VRASAFYFFVVERADGIHADNLDVGIFFFQVAADAGNRAARAHPADEVRDFSLGVLPDFRAGGAVMRLGIHRVLVLIGIEGIGNFAREFGGDGIVAARIFRLDGGGADNDFCAECFQQIDFFARLLVGDGEDDFVAAHAGHQREAHAGVAGRAFDDGAAGLQFAGALGLVNHGEPDTVFHRAAGIHVVGLDPDFGGQVFGQTIQADDRRVADSFQDVVALHVRGSAPAGIAIFTPFKSRDLVIFCPAARKCNVPRDDSVGGWRSHGSRLKANNLPPIAASKEDAHDSVCAAEICIPVMPFHRGHGRHYSAIIVDVNFNVRVDHH
jgi:hypothetical protein